MKPKAIVVHCSASRWGDAKEIDSWHRQKGWSCIGYHAVILNGKRKYGSSYALPDNSELGHGPNPSRVRRGD